ncbi:aminotransferase class I/II-fold pyridoxal phosphate-dependent enzyme [Alphaproteobacteria bacterium]|nr:aminotransferase class I/II-fold pyridoxal phosphate-dependent enzyme [Alphaproteobacteria bacterium]
MQSNKINSYVNKKLKEISRNNQLRKIHDVKRKPKNQITINGKNTISFSCNDYLGLSLNRSVIKAAEIATKKFGVGAGASRLVTGNNYLYSLLENKIKKLKKTSACCVFGSGFLANIGVISSLMNKKDLILIDELSHASTFLGSRLSGARVIQFKHNNVEGLEKQLYKFRNKFDKCLILTEGVFSMDGDISPQDDISVLKKKYSASFMLDDAHGLGVIGDGTGSNSLFKKKPDIDIYLGTLSKAVGSYGGFICGKKNLINFIINRCRSQIYTTGLPPSVLAASIKSLEIIVSNKSLIKKPLENAIFFSKLLGLETPVSPIVPIVLGDENKTLNLSRYLNRHGYLVGAIRPPTVPKGTSRLRIAFNSSHTKFQIKNLADLIKKKLKIYG